MPSGKGRGSHDEDAVRPPESVTLAPRYVAKRRGKGFGTKEPAPTVKEEDDGKLERDKGAAVGATAEEALVAAGKATPTATEAAVEAEEATPTAPGTGAAVDAEEATPTAPGSGAEATPTAPGSGAAVEAEEATPTEGEKVEENNTHTETAPVLERNAAVKVEAAPTAAETDDEKKEI